MSHPPVSKEDFWGAIFQCPTECVEDLPWFHVGRTAKVNQLEMEMMVQNNVFILGERREGEGEGRGGEGRGGEGRGWERRGGEGERSLKNSTRTSKPYLPICMCMGEQQHTGSIFRCLFATLNLFPL